MWLPEPLLLQTFTRLQFDSFIALWHLHNPEYASQLTPRTQPRAPLSVHEALRIDTLGLTLQKDLGEGLKLQGTGVWIQKPLMGGALMQPELDGMA